MFTSGVDQEDRAARLANEWQILPSPPERLQVGVDPETAQNTCNELVAAVNAIAVLSADPMEGSMTTGTSPSGWTTAVLQVGVRLASP
jgi:hypothetical protein